VRLESSDPDHFASDPKHRVNLRETGFHPLCRESFGSKEIEDRGEVVDPGRSRPN
jgi:hypothetical protein